MEKNMPDFLKDLLSQQLYQPKNKIVDRIGKNTIKCPQAEEILEKTLKDIELFTDFYRLKPPRFFITKLCQKWGKSNDFINKTLNHTKNQLQMLGYDWDHIRLSEDDTSLIFIISGLLKQLRLESAGNCINFLQGRLQIPQKKIIDKIQKDFSIIPNLWSFFDLYKIQGIDPPEYLLLHEISRLKISLWTGKAG
jgi:hypothetical protein